MAKFYRVLELILYFASLMLTARADVTTGTEFYLAFPCNGDGYTSSLIVINSNQNSVLVTIDSTLHDFATVQRTASANSALQIDFSDPHVVLGMQVCDQNEVNQQGFKVLTSLSVALYVYQSTSNGFNATQFMVLPSNMLAAEYIGGLNQTYGIIVAKQDGTVVTIGNELITLNSLDVYYYYSETNISASNPFAYILTVQYQPNSSPYSTVMALPITYAAKELFIAPDIFNYPLSCEIWATQGATEVSLNGGSNVSVPAGSAENMVLSNGGTLIASSSIQVFAASPSLQYAVYPDIFLQSSVQFSVANGNNAAQLMIIAPLDSTGNILMDGRAIPALQYRHIPYSHNYYYTQSIGSGMHTISITTLDDRYLAYVYYQYGTSNATSYAVAMNLLRTS